MATYTVNRIGDNNASTHLFSIDYPDSDGGLTWLPKMDSLLALVEATNFKKSVFDPKSDSKV